MTTKSTVIPGTPGAARVEYFACREDVEALIVMGYSVRMTYEQMRKQGRVTSSYSAFCDYVRGGGKRKHSSGKKKPKQPVQPLAQAQPRTVPQTGKSSFVLHSVDASKLI